MDDVVGVHTLTAGEDLDHKVASLGVEVASSALDHVVHRLAEGRGKIRRYQLGVSLHSPSLTSTHSCSAKLQLEIDVLIVFESILHADDVWVLERVVNHDLSEDLAGWVKDCRQVSRMNSIDHQASLYTPLI